MQPETYPQAASQHASSRKACLLIGVLCTFLALLWQFANVRYLYEGNWTALFVTGELARLPPQLAHEDIYRFPDIHGYDGQFYHYVAHDPLRRHGFSDYIDSPDLRYGRILVPGLAYLLAVGQQRFIDTAYFALVLLFVFLGAYWFSRYVSLYHRHPAWGLVFAVIPPVIVSLDRMTVGVALAAFTAGFALYTAEERPWQLYAVLLSAALVRETGLALVGAWCLYCLWRKEFARGAIFSTAAFPALFWNYLMRAGVVREVTRVSRGAWRVAGIIHRFMHPGEFPYQGLRLWVSHAVSYLGWFGILLGFVLGIRMAIRKRPGPVEIAAASAGLMGVAVSSLRFYEDPFGYCRPFASLFVVLGLHAIARRAWVTALPILLVDLHLGLQVGSKALGILRAVFS